MKMFVLTMVAALASTPALAADIEAGKARAATVCAACHGANGVSVSDQIPNLAGQRAAYLIAQLQAFKEGTRKNDLMNVIAPQLAQDDIVNVASWFASLAGAAAGAKSALLPNVARSHVTLPTDFKTGFRNYLTKDSAANKTIAIYYANDAAFAAAAAGKPLPDGSSIYIANYSAKVDGEGKPVVNSDGALVPDRLRGVSAMARDAGWGADIPEMLRNENWNYAVFTADGAMRPNVNQAECLACHKAKQASSYLFLHDALVAAARR